jgi:hypothetical protein
VRVNQEGGVRHPSEANRASDDGECHAETEHGLSVGAGTLAEGRRRADTSFVDWSDPWIRARAAWVFLAGAALAISGLAWLVGGYAFCGTDTTEPGPFGDWACESLVRPVVPWLLIAATPLTVVLLGGHIGLKRKSWGLFAVSVIGAPLLGLIGLFSLTAVF